MFDFHFNTDYLVPLTENIPLVPGIYANLYPTKLFYLSSFHTRISYYLSQTKTKL